MRMKMVRKGRREHLYHVKGQSEITQGWIPKDIRALGLIAQGIAA